MTKPVTPLDGTIAGILTGALAANAAFDTSTGRANAIASRYERDAHKKPYAIDREWDRLAADTLRALAAERDAAVAQLTEDHAYEAALRSEAIAERDAAIARAEAAERSLAELAAQNDEAGEALRKIGGALDEARARSADHNAYRTAAAAFLASRGLLPEFDAWCEAGKLGPDPVGRLVDVARAARRINEITEKAIRFYEGTGPVDRSPKTEHIQSCIIGWRYPGDPMAAWDVLPPAARELKAAIDALPPGILDQSTESD